MGARVASGAPTAAQRVSGQAGWSILAKLATVGGTLGVSILAARKLGADEFGLWSLAKNLLTYLALIGACGLDRALLRFVPELEALGAAHGLRRLFVQTLLLQGLVLGLASGLLLLLSPWWEKLFSPGLTPLLPWICASAAAMVYKESLYQLHFALAQARRLAMATTLTGALWLVLTWILLRSGMGASGALAAQAAGLAAAIGLLIPSTRLCLRQTPSLTPETVAGRRLGLYAFTQVGSSLVNMIVQRQSEVLFLAAVAPPAVVGYYDLAYSLPQLGLELVPLSLYAVVLSAMGASYARDPSRLGHLVGWYYRLLAIVTVPPALLGALWSDKLIELLYGPAMAPAGNLARIFSILHLLPFVSVPIGTALSIREQGHRTLPLGLLQVGVNLTLDVLLIPRYQIQGAIAAVGLTLLLVTPPTIRYALRFTGPVEFPWRWIGHLTLALTPGLLPALARPWLHGGAEVGAALLASAALMLLGIRWSRLLGTEEVYRLRHSHLPGKRWLLRLLTSTP